MYKNLKPGDTVDIWSYLDTSTATFCKPYLHLKGYTCIHANGALKRMKGINSKGKEEIVNLWSNYYALSEEEAIEVLKEKLVNRVSSTEQDIEEVKNEIKGLKEDLELYRKELFDYKTLLNKIDVQDTSSS